MGTELHSHYTQQQPKPFLGLRFALFGFASGIQQQVKSKLVSGGGVDVSNYTQDCTHVIVNNLVYDDPVCVLAREDGKVLVTGLWVDHSFDIGMLVDHTSIMYRPLKDLNGIPGAKNLIMCLTGYQRQDRDDVMTMVGLMGAQFSKPLVANKVTHLICYKFEGEKYELAKKMKRIKLVNHKWLEDCLSCWQILPESDYNKSGYELEMENEAKDSEDETEDKDSMQFMGREANFTPQRIRTATPMVKKLLTPNAVTSNLPLEPTGPNGPASLTNQLVIPSLIGKDARGGQASSSKDLNEKHNEAFGLQNTSKTTAFAELPDRDVATPISTKVGSNQASGCLIGKKSPLSGVEKSTSLSHSRKTLKSTFEADTSNLNSVPKLQPDEQKTCDGLNISSLKAEQVIDRNKGFSFNTPLIGSSLIQENELTSFSPKKRKITSSHASSKSQKTGQDSKPCTLVGTLVENEVEGLKLTSGILLENEVQRSELTLTRSPSEIKQFPSVDKSCSPEPKDDHAFSSSTKHSPVGMPGVKFSTYKRKSVTNSLPFLEIGEDNKAEKVRQNSYERPAESSITYKFDDVDASNSHGPVIPIGENKDSHSKPQKKKPVANKTLGSRPKLGKKVKTANLKGSLCLDRSASLNDDVLCSGGKEQTVNHDDASKANNIQGPSSLNDKETVKEIDIIYEPESSNDIERKSEAMDDETEAPDDKEELEKTARTSSELAGIKQNKDIIMEERSEEGQHMVKPKIDDAVPLEGGEQENRARGQNMELEELTHAPAAARGKKGKAKKSIRKKDTRKTLCTNTESSEHERKIDGGDTTEKVRAKPQTNGKKPEQNANTLNEKAPVKELENTVNTSAELAEVKQRQDVIMAERSEEAQHMTTTNTNKAMPMEQDQEKEVHGENIEVGEMISTPSVAGGEKSKIKKCILKKSKIKSGCSKAEKLEHERKINRGDTTEKLCAKPCLDRKKADQNVKPLNKMGPVNELENSMEVEKENTPMTSSNKNMVERKERVSELAVKSKKTQLKTKQKAGKVESVPVQAGGVRKKVNAEPRWFILSGHRLQRKEFQKVIKQLKGKVCRDSHQWSYQATHFIAPDPIRRTEKFFAAAASGRWILKSDYLSASSQAGKLLEEEPYEWYTNGLNEDGAINMEAPRKWRLLREKTGHGALYGMRIIIYGECIAPPLDTLKRAVKAGDGTILATSPPYTKLLDSGIDFAIVSPGMPRVDMWVQEFLKHEIPCVSADYLVEYVCKTGYPLEKHVQYNTQAWAENSLANLMIKSEEIVEDLIPNLDDVCEKDTTCYVCGSSDRGEVMLICGDESGFFGCEVGSHIDCCNPPLEDVPEEDWFCPKCRSSKDESNIRESSYKKVSKHKS